MNQLSSSHRARIVSCLVERTSIRSTVRMTGASKNTVVQRLVELGEACRLYMDDILKLIHYRILGWP